MIQPVLAEDGYCYERSAIVKWFERRQTSPVTNKHVPSKRVIPSHQSRTMIMALIEAGEVISERDAATWYLETAKLQLSGAQVGGMKCSEANLEKAVALGSTEAAFLLSGFHLGRMVDEWHRLAKEKGLSQTLPSFATPNINTKPLQKWHTFTEEELNVDEINQGVVKIIHDAKELERLCNRPAPGMASEEAVGFNTSFMGRLCGMLFKVAAQDPNDGTYRLARKSVCNAFECSDDAWVPYDACILQAPSQVTLVREEALGTASDS